MEVFMAKYKSNSFDTNYARAWSKNEGGFSSQVATNLIKMQNKGLMKFSSCLDILCGSGEFIKIMNQNGISVAATEIAQSMIDLAKINVPSAKFYLTPNIQDFILDKKFDLITCNHDCINFIDKLENWSALFANAYKHLNKNGYFIFDFYTKKKLQDWVEIKHEEYPDLDYIKDIKPGIDNKSIMKEIYFIKNENGTYTKTLDIIEESYFENEDIFNALKKSKFKDIYITDIEFNELSKEDIENRNRIHVIAVK